MPLSTLCLTLLAWWLVIVPCFAWQGTVALVGVIVLLVVWVFTYFGWVSPRKPLA